MIFTIRIIKYQTLLGILHQLIFFISFSIIRNHPHKPCSLLCCFNFFSLLFLHHTPFHSFLLFISAILLPFHSLLHSFTLIFACSLLSFLLPHIIAHMSIRYCFSQTIPSRFPLCSGLFDPLCCLCC